MLLRVIPVLDILNGIVVQAIRGERKKYRPLESVLCQSTDPVDIAKVFKSLGFSRLYLADLDSILGRHTNFSLYHQIRVEAALDLLIDAGISDVEKAKRVFESGASKIIIGTETLGNFDFIQQSVKIFGKDQVIVSLDMKNGKVIGRSSDVTSKDIVSLAEILEKMGITEVIVLDLSRVGADKGVNITAMAEVLKRTSLEVLTGGGVRGIGDLEELKMMGVTAALVATAIHTGKIRVKEIESKGWL